MQHRPYRAHDPDRRRMIELKRLLLGRVIGGSSSGRLAHQHPGPGRHSQTA